MTLFEELLDRAVAAKCQVHVKVAQAYFNVVLGKTKDTYHSHFFGQGQNCGIHFTIKSVRQVTVQKGTDGNPCYDIALSPLN